MDLSFGGVPYEPMFLLQAAPHVPDGIVITDRHGLITWMNDGFHRICGYELSEVMGRTPGSVLQGPLTSQATVASIRSALTQQRPCSADIVNYHKDGHPYWVSLTITPIMDNDGLVLRFMAIERDITWYKQAEDTLHATIIEQQAIIYRLTQRILLPICASCKRIRTSSDIWERIDWYIAEHSRFDFTHTFCPDCVAHLYPEEEP